MKRTYSALFVASTLVFAGLGGCGGVSTPPAYDFSFPRLDLSASVMDSGTGKDLAQTPPTDFSGVDLTGVDLGTAPIDMATDGGTSSATLTLNEVNPRITTGDEVELRAHGAGSVSGWTVSQGIGASAVAVATLPTLTVADGDFIVVHLKAAMTVTAESTAKTTCTDATCVATAWDEVGSTTQDLTNSAQVITLANPMGTIVDGLAFSNGSGSATWPAQLQALQTAAVWDQTPCANTCAKPDADALSVLTSGTPAVGTTVAGVSMQRTDSLIPSTKAHWTVKASTWGAAN
ncbi:MAG: hypothetical protein ABI321_06365 [Polyangia bacterium]